MTRQANPTEERIQRIGAGLYALAQSEWHRLQRAHRWEFEVLRWCLEDAALRTRILRFIDCLPALTRPRDVVRHLREYFPEPDSRSALAEAPPLPAAGSRPPRSRLPAPLRLGLAATRPALLTAPAVAAATRRIVTGIARLFIAGATPKEAAAPIGRLAAEGFRVSVDLLGETTVSQAEAERCTQSYLALIDHWGSLFPGPLHLSLKLSSLAFPFEPIDPDAAWRQAAPRLRRIFQAVEERGGFLNLDMEQHALRDLTLEIAQRLLEEQIPKASSLGVVIQSYLKDSEQVTERLLEWARRRRASITVRLVRGAYWDTEVILAQQRQWPCPVYLEKAQTDACFERLTDLLLRHHPEVRLAVGTHNLRSIARVIARAEEWKVPQERWECQVLYGVNEALHHAVRRSGVPVRIYTPIGEWLPGMAYLVRRILENTSQYSFLSAGLMEQRPAQEVLEAPVGL